MNIYYASNLLFTEKTNYENICAHYNFDSSLLTYYFKPISTKLSYRSTVLLFKFRLDKILLL